MALTSVSDLQNLIYTTLAHQFTLPAVEKVPLVQAAGRVLAEDIQATLSLPYADVSAMDGYAIPCAAQAGEVFTVIGESIAGRGFEGVLATGQAVRIMTGAVLPQGAKAVVMQENIQRNAEKITLSQEVSEGEHIRYAGEEIAPGLQVLPARARLTSADIMLLAACGIAEVSVFRPLRVAVISGGDEVREPGEALTNHSQIYDSNRPMLMARLRQLPVTIIDCGAVPDQLDGILARLKDAASRADVIITSGGVSVGDYDFMRDAVNQIGVIHHYKVAMKPGKPFVFGRIQEAWYFGLPGNPVSGFVGFDVFLKRALWQLAGVDNLAPPLAMRAQLIEAIDKKAGRMEFQRGVIRYDETGTLLAAPLGRQDSHRVLGVSHANAYLILPEDNAGLDVGDEVMVWPFTEAFL